LKTCFRFGGPIECEQISLRAVRKSNSKRKDSPSLAFLKKYFRRRIETVFSQIKAGFPAHLHAVTAEGFLPRGVRSKPRFSSLPLLLTTSQLEFPYFCIC
jgi:hypothetical protein